MKLQAMLVALSALASISTVAANAAQYEYGVGSTQVMTYPAVVNTAATGSCATISDAAIAAPLSCAPLFGDHTYYDNGTTVRRGGLLSSLSLGLLGSRDEARVITNSAVIPGLGTAQKICGQRLSNSLFDIRLFGFGIGFGKVAPPLDMRHAGHAI